ncbi:MAG TPA: LysE family transporter [Burkholderiaceae bacterium]|nr:LysE family transporter [Burkholderiaceae bacterium]
MLNAIFFSGFLTSLALIVPIGAQNAFVLKLGLMRQHVLVIALLCGFMDAVLILLGVTFAGATFGQYAWTLLAVKYVGVAFLLAYGFRAFLAAYKHAQPMAVAPLNQTITLKSALVTCLGFTLLNPHVYLDTVLLIGGISVQYKPNQYDYAMGALTASFTWFLALGFGARLLRPLFVKAQSWVVLEIAIGLLMWSIAYHIWFLPIAV